MGPITGSKWLETNNFLLKRVSLFLFWEMKAIPWEKLPRNRRARTKRCTTSFTEQRKLALTRIEREVGGPGAQLSKRTNTLECRVWESVSASSYLSHSLALYSKGFHLGEVMVVGHNIGYYRLLIWVLCIHICRVKQEGQQYTNTYSTHLQYNIITPWHEIISVV